MTKILFVFALCFLALFARSSVAIGPRALSNSSQAEARRVEIREAGFSLVLPPEMKEVPVAAVDSFVVTFEGAGLKLLIDYGAYSDSFRTLPDGASGLEVRQESIDGKNAKLVTYRLPSEFPYFAGVHFAELGRGPMFKLTLAANARTPEAQASAVRIMRSILFTTP